MAGFMTRNPQSRDGKSKEYLPHTAGPWQMGDVQQSWTEIWGPDDAEGGHEILGSTIGSDQKANARLIASAPDLLAALKVLHTMLHDLPMPAANNVISAAIAKAEGKGGSKEGHVWSGYRMG